MAQCEWLAEGGHFPRSGGHRRRRTVEGCAAQGQCTLRGHPIARLPRCARLARCLAEVRKAEDFGKEIIVVLMRDVQFEDRRLDGYKDRQIVDVSAPPQSHVETVQYRGNQYEVRFNDLALASIKEYLSKRGIMPTISWPPADRSDADPFPGLSAFTEDDAGIFFGRDSDILRGLDKLRLLRRNGHPRLLLFSPPPARENRPTCAPACGRGSRAIRISHQSPSCGRHKAFSPGARGWGANWRCNCRAPAPRSMPATFTRNSWRKTPRKLRRFCRADREAGGAVTGTAPLRATQKRRRLPDSRGRSGGGAVRRRGCSREQALCLSARAPHHRPADASSCS